MAWVVQDIKRSLTFRLRDGAPLVTVLQASGSREDDLNHYVLACTVIGVYMPQIFTAAALVEYLNQNEVKKLSWL